MVIHLGIDGKGLIATIIVQSKQGPEKDSYDKNH